MDDSSAGFFSSKNFMPHGHCFLWASDILWTHVLSDVAIGSAYFSIFLTIIFLARKRKCLPFRNIFLLFGFFVALCGLTHFLSIWVLWNPDYGPEGIIKALTAVVSVFSAILAWRVIPHALLIPLPGELEEINFKLKQFQVLVDGVTDYAIYMLDTKGCIVSWNRGAQRIKGYESQEIIGQNFSKFYTHEDQKLGEPDHALDIAVHEGKYEQEVWRVRKDGTTFRAHVMIEPIYDIHNCVIGYAKVTRDVTEQYKIQETLEKTREQLYQAQKMEMLGHLTGGIAHDFNNLLQVIMGGLALAARFISDDKAHKHIAMAQKAASRGALLTEQLLAVSLKQSLRPEILDVNWTIQSFESILHQACNFNIQLRYDYADDSWPVKIDKAKLQSGLLNLVINARDAMPYGGIVTIQTKNVILTQSQADELHGVTSGSYVVISVIDTGSGMTPDVISRAIEPFYTTKEVGKGSGLGLSQVYGFVRQSEGQLEIQSELGHGTVIRLYLPKSAEIV